MKMGANSYTYVAVLVLALVIIALSMQLKYLSTKQLPLIIGGIIFVVAAIGLVRDIRARNKPKTAATNGKTVDETETEINESWYGYALNGAWVLGFFLGITFLGFILAIPVFLIVYLMVHGMKWYSATIFAVLTSAIVYVVFVLALDLDLYKGLLFIWLGY